MGATLVRFRHVAPHCGCHPIRQPARGAAAAPAHVGAMPAAGATPYGRIQGAVMAAWKSEVPSSSRDSSMVVLINLESAQLRRAAMTKRLAEQRLRHQRVGVDMRHLSRDEVTAWCASAFPTLAFDLDVLSCAEVGCWASHLIAWRRLVEQSTKHFCTVLEDDVVLRPAFAAAIATLSQRPHPFDLVYLGTSSRLRASPLVRPREAPVGGGRALPSSSHATQRVGSIGGSKLGGCL